MSSCSYTDDQLAAAIAASRSWRGVLRHLHLTANSASAMRSARRKAEQLGLDHSHFTGGRRWTEDDLAAAISASRTWEQVLVALGLSGGSSASLVKGHALRLGFDTSHFGRAQVEAPAVIANHCPDLSNLPRAGSMLAAAWFTVCGYDVTWPLEPCRYDLIVSWEGRLSRIQVKTCYKKQANTWQVSLSTSGHPTAGQHTRRVYDPDDIDDKSLGIPAVPAPAATGPAGIGLRSSIKGRDVRQRRTTRPVSGRAPALGPAPGRDGSS